MQDEQNINPSKIRDFIVETFLFGKADDLSNDTSFIETGIIDSMGILKVADFIERTYGITLKANDLVPENLDSVDNIVNFLKRSRDELS